MKVWKKILGIAGIIVAIPVVGFLIILAVLTVKEYKPAKTEKLEVTGAPVKEIQEGDSIRIMSWNVGYCGLDKNADFFMDGGKHVSTATKGEVQNNLDAVVDEIKTVNPDVVFLQEVDQDSKRSYHLNEQEYIADAFKEYASSYAWNYKVLYVPYPWPPIGKVQSGIMTLSNFEVSQAERDALPSPFKYPVSIANLKRCLLVSRVPLKDSDKELVLVNLHLEAYDEGDGKIAQTEMLRQVLQTEADKGNYVIAGGDFNQIFSNVDASVYPTLGENYWCPGEIDTGIFGEDWQFFMDTSTPTCRSLDKVYAGADKENFQFYMLDGFIVSKNISIQNMTTQDLNFEHCDHNPIVMNLTLEK